MTPIDIAASAPATSSKANGTSDNQPEAKLDEGFRNLLSKLTGERHIGKDAPRDSDRDRPVGKRPDKAVHARDTEKHSTRSPARDAGDRSMTEDSALPEQVSDGAIRTPADIAETQPTSLPDLLQALPQKAPARTGAADMISPVRPGSQKPGIQIVRPDAANHEGKTESGRDPFAALTSLLAKEDFGTEGEPVSLADRKVETPKITVVSRETHFEPIIRSPPVQQVANAIVGQIANPSDEAGSRSAPADIDTLSLRTQSDGPLKILHIKLEPDNLGEVSVKMRLVGGALELHLEASRAETVELLMKDKDVLNRLLRASGYTPDVVTIQAGADSGSPQSSTSQQNNSGSSHQNPSAHGGAQPDGRRGSGGEQDSPRNHIRSSETPHDEAVPTSDRDLYL
jgi:hypothetical protein